MKHPFLIPTLMLLLSGCIERYYPGEEELQTGTLVVVAHIHDLPGIQSVYLSRSSTLNLPQRDPISDCYVELERADGTTMVFEESKPGQYDSYLDESYLETGQEFRLLFITPDGNRYESEFEKLVSAPEIESLYFTKEDRPTANPEDMDEGVQFYIDYEIEKESGRFLRWQLIETYELHNPDYLSTSMYDVDRTFKDIPDSIGWRTCWITREVPEIFTKDLGNVQGSLYQQMPLSYVSGRNPKLLYRYSLLVRQLALSEASFWYWDELRKNLQTKGGLFDTQPSLTPSNICNVEDEDELVIGYFSISGASESRIFVEDVPDLEVYEDPYFCTPGGLPKSFWRLTEAFLPYYMAMMTMPEGGSINGGVQKECIDCRAYFGSSHIIPDFWY